MEGWLFIEIKKPRTGVRGFSPNTNLNYLISIMLGLERPFGRDAKVLRLRRGELGQFRTELVEMQPRHLFVQRLGQDINAVLIFLARARFPQLDLRDRLVGEARR